MSSDRLRQDALSYYSSLITHHSLLLFSSPRVLDSFPALFKHLAIPNKACTRIGGQFEVLRQLQARGRAGFLAERAKHAARCVEDKLVQHFLFTRFAGDDDLH